MPDAPHAQLRAWLRDHHGVVARPDLAQMGFSSSAIGRMVERGELVIAHRGVYRSSAHPRTRLQTMAVACAVAPGGAIGFTTAGQELGLRGMTDARIHLLVPHGSTPTIAGVTCHRCRRIDPIDLAGWRPDGIRLTSPPRTIHDAAAVIGPERTESAIEQVLQEGRCTIGTLMATGRRLFHGNRPGSAIFTEVIGARPRWRGLARSDLELRVRTAIAAAGLPEPETNRRLVLPDGQAIVIDLAWIEWSIAVEVDHPFWHDGRREAARDKRRDRKLQALGWATPRLSTTDVDHGLADAVDDLRRILVLRGWRPDVAA